MCKKNCVFKNLEVLSEKYDGMYSVSVNPQSDFYNVFQILYPLTKKYDINDNNIGWKLNHVLFSFKNQWSGPLAQVELL